MTLHPDARLSINGIPVPFPVASEPGSRLRVIKTPAEVMQAMADGAPFCLAESVIDEAEAPQRLHTLTSGSSGAPKRIRRTYDSWIASARVNSALFGLTSADKTVILGGLEHSLALYALFEALVLGMAVDVLTGVRPDRQADAIAKMEATHLYATPTQLRLISTRPLPSLRNVVVGGGKLDERTQVAFWKHTPSARLVPFYGAAETSFMTIGNDETAVHSVGRPYPKAEIALRNVVDGIGEVWVKSPYLFLDYAEGASATTIRDGDWMTVGELGTIIDSSIHIVGRVDRMFQVADQSVYPELIEEKLLSTKGVESVAVLPLPDPVRGNIPVALYSGTASPDDLDIRRAFRLESFPTLPSGKPDYVRLRALLQSLA
ncbi:long-chain fatty acid--CoA ligase [Marivivens donghaensis]|uniref:Long-chain fatty acid--CoA ligase n=1 Tax=Marivivens donghaensis TaxID=1699413 RepID=A0ABX0W3J0_9RHOB|nr:AMP-binding protein [Marivivens donghaensis]NIY73809.1 long-chain fatty acid--CoA ligase [Marivivens donghaensis]